MKWHRSRAKGIVTPASLSATVLGLQLHYLEIGAGPPMVFLQLGVADAQLWRGVLPYLAPRFRCVVVDLPGTGSSERLSTNSPADYDLGRQRTWFGAFMELMGFDQDVVLVVHGMGSIVGLAWAADHSGAVRGVAHVEAVLRPMIWADLSQPFRDLVRRAREPGGESFVTGTMDYFDQAITSEALYPLAADALQGYRSRFGPLPQSRLALYAAIKGLPIGGSPPAVRDVVARYSAWLNEWNGPKLCILGSPGYLATGRLRLSAESIKNQHTVEVRGRHLLPEDSPDGVGRFLTSWMTTTFPHK